MEAYQDFLTEPSPDGDAPGEEDDLTEALDLIRRGAATIDRLWSEAQTTPGATGLELALGEASQGVHRALSAISGQPSRVEPPRRLVPGMSPEHGCRSLERLFSVALTIQSAQRVAAGCWNCSEQLEEAAEQLDLAIGEFPRPGLRSDISTGPVVD